MELTKKIFQ